MSLSIKIFPVESFGAVSLIAVHCKPEGFPDIEGALESAERDGFELVCLYVDADELSDWLSDELSRFAESCTDADDSEESAHAEYVATVGYSGEAMHEVRDGLKRLERHESVDADLVACIEARLDELSDRDGALFIQEITELRLIHGIRSVDGELYSATIGETEHELPESLRLCLEALPLEARKAAVRSCDVYIDADSPSPSHAYSDRSYDRWSLILDEEKAREALDFITTEQALELGRDRGECVASWVDLPELGLSPTTTVARECGLDFEITDEHEAKDYWLALCSDAESRDRDFTPFEFTASRFNRLAHAEALWAAYDEGLVDGYETSWKARVKASNFYAPADDDKESAPVSAEPET